MIKLTLTKSMLATLFVTLTFSSPGRAAFTSPLPETIPLVNGRSITSKTNTLTCNRVAGPYTPLTVVRNPNLTIAFSSGWFPDASTSGSWMVRSLLPSGSGGPDVIGAYFYDGRFAGPPIPSGMKPEVLYGRTRYRLIGEPTYISASFCGSSSGSFRAVISGECGTNKVINLEILAGTERVATGVFTGNVTCGSGSETSINKHLNRH
ncbi:MAG TPA: hypothetical protein VFZ40_18675 [Pyrinomonadaceae bacterium]